MDDWKIEIVSKPGMTLVDVYIFRRRAEGGMIVLKPEPNSVYQEQPFDMGTAATPSLTLPEELLPLLLDALERKGVKPTEQSYVEGVLESQSKHLADMRTLLKLK